MHEEVDGHMLAAKEIQMIVPFSMPALFDLLFHFL